MAATRDECAQHAIIIAPGQTRVLQVTCTVCFPLVLMAAALLRGTYYPAYQYIVLALTMALLTMSVACWEPGRRGVRPIFLTIWAGLLVLLSMASGLWAAIPMLALSATVVSAIYLMFLLSFAFSGRQIGLPQGSGALLWWYAFAIAGTAVALTGIGGFILQIYPWAMTVDGIPVAASCLEYPNGLAVYALMTLAPTVYLHGALNVAGGAGRRRIWLVRAAICIQIIGILLSFSKTGFIFLTVLAVYLLVKSRHRGAWAGHIMPISIVLVSLAGAAYLAVTRKLPFIEWLAFDIAPRTITGHRLATWKGSLEALLDRVWFGWGGGSYGFIYQGYARDSLTKHAHNIFLHAGVEFGVLGLVLFAMLYAYCSWLIVTVLIGRSGAVRADDAGEEPECEPTGRMVGELEDESTGKHVDELTLEQANELEAQANRQDAVHALSFSCGAFLINNLWDFSFYIPGITLLFFAQAAMLRSLLIPSLRSPLLRFFKP